MPSTQLDSQGAGLHINYYTISVIIRIMKKKSFHLPNATCKLGKVIGHH
jgi:hypothetical protein